MRRSILVAACFSCLGLAAYGQERVRLTETDAPVTFDGLLTEPAWQEAPPITEFRQRDPREGEPASERTEIRLLVHAQTLYIGVTCFDSDPAQIVAKEMRRDGAIEDDDHVAVVLDTYLDHRNAFYFAFNANGALKDALVVDEDRGFNQDWNGKWDVKARVTDQGWQAEVKIPFDTLRFGHAKEQAWGANFRRLIRRKNEEVLWQAFARNAGLMRLSAAGIIEGIPRPQASHRVELRPYVAGSWIETPPSPGALALPRDFEGKTGLDAKLKLAASLTADLTVNTDFAQTEVDKAVVNLTRFPVEFPEKRDFFLENAGYFDFASQSQTKVFFSRRIGLSPKGEPIPLTFGARVTGKIGRFDVGALNARSGATATLPATDYTVLRSKLGVFAKSYVGAIFTDAYDSRDGHRNQAYGLDASFSFSNVVGQNLSITGSLAGTAGRQATRDRGAGFFSIYYPNDNLEAFFNYGYIQKNFNPEVGFLQRSAFEQYSAKWRFQPRPPAPWNKWIRKIYIKPLELNVYRTLPTHQLESLEQEFRPIGMDFQSGDAFELNIIRQFDRLDEPFDVFGSVVIPKGRYWWNTYELQLATSGKRRWSLGSVLSTGGYYDGTMRGLAASGALSLTRRLSLAVEYATNHAHFETGRFTTHDLAGRVVVAFSNRANLQIFTQWNNETHVANVYLRLQITPKVGSDIFGIFNQLLDTRRGRWSSLGRAARTKTVYPIDF